MDNVDRWVGVADNAELDGSAPRRHGARLRAVGQPAALLEGGPRRPRAGGRPVEPRREVHRRGPLHDGRGGQGRRVASRAPRLRLRAHAVVDSRYIIDQNGLYDEPFVKHWTNLPFLINPDTRLAYRAEEVWPDYVNPAADPDRRLRYPGLRVLRCAQTNSVQPFPFTAPEDCAVDPAIFATATVNGKEAKTAGQIYWEEARALDLWRRPARRAGFEPENASARPSSCMRLARTSAACQQRRVLRPPGELLHRAAGGAGHRRAARLHVESPLLGLPESRRLRAARPTVPTHAHWACSPTSFERYGLGWTTGLTKAENDRLLDAIVAGWDAKGRDGEEMQPLLLPVPLRHHGRQRAQGHPPVADLRAEGAAARASPPASPTVRA